MVPRRQKITSSYEGTSIKDAAILDKTLALENGVSPENQPCFSCRLSKLKSGGSLLASALPSARGGSPRLLAYAVFFRHFFSTGIAGYERSTGRGGLAFFEGVR